MGPSHVAQIAEVIAAIQLAPDEGALTTSVSDGLNALGFDRFNLSVNANGLYGLLTPELTTFDADFFVEYERLGFVEYDPVLAYSVSSDQAFCWSSQRAIESIEDKKLLDFIRAIPLRRGMVVPLPSMPGRVSTANLSASRDVTITETSVYCASIFMRVAVIKAESLGLCKGDAQARLVDADLSVRQLEILNWAALGKSNSDIATILNMSKRSVDYHMSIVLQKLSVATRMQAVALIAGSRRGR